MPKLSRSSFRLYSIPRDAFNEEKQPNLPNRLFSKNGICSPVSLSMYLFAYSKLVI